MDAHNIVPCWVASPKLEYAARTIRGKITKQLPEFLTDFPPVEKHPHAAGRTAEVRPPLRNLSRKYGGLWRSPLERDLLTFGPASPSQPVDWEETLSSLNVDRTVGETAWARPGAAAGLAMLESFIDERLKRFDSRRNDPNVAALSQMSPWIRFGESQSPSVLACRHTRRTLPLRPRRTRVSPAGGAAGPARREEGGRGGRLLHRGAGGAPGADGQLLLLQREVRQRGGSVRFWSQHGRVGGVPLILWCFWCSPGAYEWARKTLKDHAQDKRPYIYTRRQLEEAQTHDPLWNAAQVLQNQNQGSSLKNPSANVRFCPR